MNRNTARDVEHLERRMLMAAGATAGDLRSFDGAGNNLLHPEWGAAGTTLLRLVAAEYADGLAAPAGADRPSAREISNAIAAHPEDEELNNDARLAAFAYVWGQFIDHDLDLTTNAKPSEPFNVEVPQGDEHFDQLNAGGQVIRLNRSVYLGGSLVASPREQLNEITSYLDGSMIYGSDDARAAALRSFVGGHLLTSDGDLLPFNTEGLTNANDAHRFPDDELFVAGDVRANENIELTALHTLFLREHNRLADEIAADHPSWDDEAIFQQARRMVIGEIQAITYNEFLPALLGGRRALPRYRGYDPAVDASISTEFSTAAFRVGHSMLADDVEFFSDDGEEVAEEMPLAEAFFNPEGVTENGIEPILKYLASSNAEQIDNMIVDGVRNFLFGPPGAGGFDLASLNIQRGRDHGLADYNDTREALGLSRVTSFSQITSDDEVAAKLEEVYGDVDNVDLWVGGLAEDHVAGGSLGATFRRIIVDQFTRLRDGDRFWYERDLKGADLKLVRNTSLADVISANTGLENLQANVFVFDVDVAGQVYSEGYVRGGGRRGRNGVAGVKLELVDEEGEVIDSAVTKRDGRYRFANVQIGEFTVRIADAGKWKLTTEGEVEVAVSRGGDIKGVDFGVRRSGGVGGIRDGGTRRTLSHRTRQLDSLASRSDADTSSDEDLLLA